jgi:hypothetical protein
MNHDRSPRLPSCAFPALVTEANTRGVDQRLSPAVLPDPPPPPHRPGMTRRPRAISSIPSPRAKTAQLPAAAVIPAAARRVCTRPLRIPHAAVIRPQPADVTT